MEAPGKGVLKVTSILFIVFGGIAAVLFLVSLIGAAALSGSMGYYGYQMGGLVAGAIFGAAIVGLIACALDIVIGILGLKKCADPKQYNFFIVTGIVLSILELVSLVMNFSPMSLIGFILPILYIYGGWQNKNAKLIQ
jgi:hypothetical protein